MLLSLISENCLNCCRHYSIAKALSQKIIVLLLILDTIEIPTNVFPAPHGKTITPERAFSWINTLLKAFS